MKSEEMVEEITLVIKAKASIIPGHSKNYLHIQHADCFAKISVDGVQIGEVGGTMGAGYEIEDKRTGYTWYIRPEEFWNAYEKRES